MSELERIKKFKDYLIYDGKIKFQNDMAVEMGYSIAVFSQIMTGKKNLPKKFSEKLANHYPEVSLVWLKTGEGEMLSSTEPSEQVSDKPLEEQSKDELIALLRNQTKMIMDMGVKMNALIADVSVLRDKIDSKGSKVINNHYEL